MVKICKNCGKILNAQSENCFMCKSIDLEKIDTSIKATEITNIAYVSDDINFTKAMIELYDTNIVEYNIKINQLLQQKKQSKNTPKCPKCNSTSITTGARGVNGFWGFIGASQTVNRCGNCGHTWKP